MNAITRSHGCLLVGSLGLAALLATHLNCAVRPATAASAPAVASRQASDGRLYGRTIVVGREATPELRRLADTLAAHLERGTGVPFAVVEAADRDGIRLLTSNFPEVPADVRAALSGAGSEAYFLRSTGDGKLLIIANSARGLAFGGYQWLERLGFRFYFPSEAWTITPRLSDIELRLDGVVRPAFRKRWFSGTGGFGKRLAVDPNGELSARWATWKTANGFGEEFRIGGHIGESFNVRNRATLLAHPDYLASVDGRRVPWSKGAKLDPSNPAAVELFVRDRVQAYRAQIQRDSDPASRFAVSVEPADGAGHCNSPECAKIGGPSEQVFFLANAVARALAKEFPEARASLFAYNFHSDIPRIALEPNLYVTLIPYAFRRTSTLDSQTFIKEWGRKHRPLSIYDYWSIPDWVADVPAFDYRHVPADKLRFWHEQKIEGFAGESTYSAGAMGLGWYVAGHLMWDPSRDPKALTDEFFSDCFATAGPAMRRMLERWAAGFLLTTAELHESFADLARALELSASKQVSARLVDYAGYLQYLRLRYEWLYADEPNKAERKRALVSHIWRIYHSAMVHTFRLQKLLLRGDLELAQDFAPKDAELPIWKTLHALGEDDARKLVREGLLAFPKSDLEVKVYAGPLVAASSTSPASAGRSQARQTASAIQLVGAAALEVTVPDGTSALDVSVTASRKMRARIIDGTGRELAGVDVGPGPPARVLSARLDRGGVYRVDLRGPRHCRTSLTFAAGVDVELQEFRIPAAAPAPDLFFFVPRGEKRVAIHSRNRLRSAAKNGPSFVDSSETVVPAELLDGGHVLVASVPPGQDGKVWSLRRAVAPAAALRLLNAPQRFALSAGALRVPSGALDGPAPARPHD